MGWIPVEDGRTIQSRGSEDGIIVYDEEHTDGARITLEKEAEHAPFAITCGIYGWFFHTRYLANVEEAGTAYQHMRADLAALLLSLPLKNDSDQNHNMVEFSESIAAFVERYP